jgi:hypothetical protein
LTEEKKEQKKIYDKKRYLENKEKVLLAVRNYRKKNIEKVKEYDRNRPNRNERNEQKKLFYLNNKESKKKYDKEYTNKNKGRRNKRELERTKNDMNYKILTRLRKPFAKYLKQCKKVYKTVDLLGCSIDFFKKHLESLFDEKMNWDNYGSYWHIDHILPCAAFDLRNSEEQEICFHWTNMRPLEKIENIKKRDKIL